MLVVSTLTVDSQETWFEIQENCALQSEWLFKEEYIIPTTSKDTSLDAYTTTDSKVPYFQIFDVYLNFIKMKGISKIAGLGGESC